jgi:hypothetical protein
MNVSLVIGLFTDMEPDQKFIIFSFRLHIISIVKLNYTSTHFVKNKIPINIKFAILLIIVSWRDGVCRIAWGLPQSQRRSF